MGRDTLRAIDRLGALFGDRCQTGETVCLQHGNTLSIVANQPPDAVFFPETIDDIVKVLEIASEHWVPVVAFGAGTSLEGHVNAPSGGISLDMSRMNAILRTSLADHDCTVEAGVTRRQLNAHLRETDLFFSVDPGADSATLGGMAATRASGTNTVRYGTMSDNVLSLTAVMADGTIVETGPRSRKSSAGYDLTRLLIGSEGTLGIIARLTLRLHPRPEMISAGFAAFPDVASACAAALELTQRFDCVARVELVDSVAMGAVNRYSALSLALLPALFMEWHTARDSAAIAKSRIRESVLQNGGCGLEIAQNKMERHRLWRARHDAFWAVRSAWPDKIPVVTDVCVPVSRLAECIELTLADIAQMNLVAPVIGHVGDGNFHTIVMIDPSDGSAAAVNLFLERLSDRACAMDGSCSGEHGIGQGKMAALARQAGNAVGVMRQIKTALDPKGILNPGKIFSADEGP